MLNGKVIKTIQIYGVLQFLWHYIDVTLMGATFWTTHLKNN